MGKDPAFLFYPGDYLRDTQCLSEKSQVAYDRIMCEHMRNISNDMLNIRVSKDRVDFFIKRLSEPEREEVLHVLVENGNGYQIEWVAISISKRKAYSESRADNRRNKNKEHMKTYDEHMEDENENENESIIKDRKENKKPSDFDYQKADFFIERAKLHFKSVVIKRDEFANDIRKLQDIDKLSKDDIELICEYLTVRPNTENFCWFDQIGTPGKLRRRAKNEMTFWDNVLKEIKTKPVSKMRAIHEETMRRHNERNK